MNENFKHHTQAGGFATAVVMTYVLKTKKLSICNAGHPHPLIYKHETGEWSTLDCDCQYAEPLTNLPIGIFSTTQYKQFDVKIAHGDIVLSYTDSLIEARNAEGDFLGIEGLLALVRSLPLGTTDDFHTRVLDTIRDLHDENLTQDDVTAMVFSPNKIAAHSPIKTMLSMPGLFLTAMIQRFKDKSKPIPWPAMFSR